MNWRSIILLMRIRGRRVPGLLSWRLAYRAIRCNVPFVQFSNHEENGYQDAHRHKQGKPAEQRCEKREEVHNLYLLSPGTENGDVLSIVDRRSSA